MKFKNKIRKENSEGFALFLYVIQTYNLDPSNDIAKESSVTEINKKIGTPENDETIFSLLKNSSDGIIKSIQSSTFDYTYGEGQGRYYYDIPIQAVNQAKSIIIVSGFCNFTSADINNMVHYWLNTSTSIRIANESYLAEPTRSNIYYSRFWGSYQVIEFY